MAWFSLGKTITVSTLLLTFASLSFQGCPQGGVYPDPVDEGPTSKGAVLAEYGNGTIRNLTVQNDAQGYLAIDVSSDEGGAGGYDFTLYIAKEIDLETLQQDSLSGSVVCSDDDVTTGYSPSYVLITIAAVNEFPPLFDGSPYTQNIPEDSAIGSTVFDLSGRATDNDYPPATQMLYAIEDNDSPFLMDNGNTVVLDQLVDYESEPRTYVLNISAHELGINSPLTSYTTLTVDLTDVDDLGPRFTHNATYTLALPEGVYHNEVFNTEPPISAIDGDSLNEEVQLELDPTFQGQVDRFTVLTNGSLQVTGALDPDHTTFNVRAFQTNRPSDRFAVSSVTVTVYDVNDHSPVMARDAYSAHVQESALPGTVALTVAASDADQGVNSSFQFHLNDSSVPFSVSTEGPVGIVTVDGALDREAKHTYLLHVYAQEDQTPEGRRSNVSEVTVTLVDVNDNSPVFRDTPYVFNLTETDLEGALVGQVNATDADSGNNGEITYSVTTASAQSTDAFSVAPSTGVITLARNLTQQDIGIVFLDVRADDNGTAQLQRSQSTRVKINIAAVNQYAPVFSADQYNFTVKETVQIGVTLGPISAADQDQDTLTYWLTNSDSHDFQLEGDPPSLVVNGSMDLDTARAERERTFGVVVSDGQFESTATVTVHVTPVNEYPPVFGQAVYFVSVKENETYEEDLLTLDATDEDAGADGEIEFNITSPLLTSSDQWPFVLNGSSGRLDLSCSSGPSQTPCLDYDDQRQYTLVLSATDGGVPARSAFSTVVVTVLDVNNRAPVFAVHNITGTVPENSQLGTTVLQLEATDEDTPTSNMVYSIQDVSPPGWLTLQQDFVITNGSLDAESSQYVTATVVVSDGVQEATALLNVAVLDENDNYPQISIIPSSIIDIHENATVGTQVVSVTAQDADVSQGGSFLFYFGSSPSGKFSINSSSGDITVAAPFDRRLRKTYEVTISVSDNSSPPKINSTTLQVTITDSNSAPLFVDSWNSSVAGYSFNVSEAEDVGYVVGFVKAMDPDSGSSGNVRYSIDRGNEEGVFALDDSTGQLSLLQRLDFEREESYSLTIVARDNSYEPKSSSTVVAVKVEDVVEAPQWPERLPTVHLASSQLCRHVQLEARPRDILATTSSSESSSSSSSSTGSGGGGVLYSLLNHTDLFQIHNQTGLLSTVGTLPSGTYTLGLRACSLVNESVCSDAALTIVVTADDVITFCPPFLTVNVSESEATGHVLVDMNATHGDSNVSYSLTGESSLPFGIEESTGIITVQEELDRETIPLYTLEVVALYNPTQLYATAQVTVVVEDVPDWAPRFLLTTYHGQISEAAHVGDPVLSIPGGDSLMVSAEDKDLNPVLTYSIPASEDNSRGAFRINSSSGEVALQQTIDLENLTADMNGQFTLIVTVTDGHSSDNATLVITVLNDNDNSPVFDPLVFTFNVSEVCI